MRSLQTRGVSRGVHLDWGNYFETCQALVQCMEISIARDGPLDYPAGSMFWTLGSSASLLDLDLKVSDFPDEQGQIDGTLAHAIERLFFQCLRSARLPMGSTLAVRAI